MIQPPLRARPDFDLADHVGPDRRSSLAAAIAGHVRPRDTVHVAYADARPNAALHQLVRHWAGRDPRLTLVTAGMAGTQHALVETGVVSKVIASFAGENLPTPRPNPAFQRAVAEHRVEIENWSLWSLTARLVAGALGVPHLPVRSLVGSDMAGELAGHGYQETDTGDGPIGQVSALRPDVVLMQAVAADRAGNVVLSAPYGEGLWGAMAARRGVIVCAERIVDTATIREHATLTRIPAHQVLAVCEVPYGSHPYGLYNPGLPGVPGYAEDEAFLLDALDAAGTSDGYRRWIGRWLYDTGDHDGYLRALGERRLAALHEAADPDRWREHLSVPAPDPAASPAEAMIVAAARQLSGRIRAGGHQAILAGVGQANLAAWLASHDLKATGTPVRLMAEIGMSGYDPRPGDPFIFAKQNIPTCTMVSDVMTVLGTLVSGPATRSMGVIGAGQIDGAGNINSTWTSDGTFLVGSGGANDVATADEVLVTVGHSRRRLVERVPYVTCPGRAVRTVVTTEAVLERGEDGFVLTGVLGTRTPTREDVRRVADGCGFRFEVARDVTAVPPATPDELTVLRMFDPARRFLGRIDNRKEMATP